MTTTNRVDVTDRPPLAHRQAMALQAAELQRLLDVLTPLPDAAWAAPTDCTGWDVRAITLHLLGACEAGASVRENLRQLRAAKRRQRSSGGPLEAALSAVQIASRTELTPAGALARLRASAPHAVRGRTRMPALARRVTIKVDGPVVERWSLGYLVDTIYLRDLWMHRVDIARATGTPLVLTAEHDGVIVADVVAEWARRDGRAFDVVLTGPAGGRFTSRGLGGAANAIEPLTIDAVELCRGLAGRAPANGALPEAWRSTIVPF